ncbi:hypothetical protein J3L11_17295 [Shewanella sp. 4t3-1-2LB]|uniref:C45 family autoproteolytic acyltransferase/hydolase n=1 Tax=Shewanella sp. 4t3-1-2LB TaxID=2817682 RepID=UPI001A999290|nr:C45 family peptidase [Shewanella sp. 4t3-1-2LB]MBO1273394.1 hypothetical protein [Shewanella sp. 4t3-1-2LB]
MYHPRFQGDHYTIGLKYGSLLRKNNITLFGYDKLDYFQFEYGVQSEKILKQHFPEACAEIRGIADGLCLPYKIFSAWLLCISVCMEVQGCSMVALNRNGHVVFGRNNDLSPIFRKISNSALYRPERGNSFIANSSAFVCAEEGINEKGLAIGMTYVWAKKLNPGFNSMFLVRYILEKCATVAEGIDVIKNVPIGGAFHLFLADTNGIMHAECCPEKVLIHQGNFAFASNHFISDEMKEYEEPKDLFHSYERYQTGTSHQGSDVNCSPVEFAKSILSGKKGFMCQYNKNLNFDTVWSSVFDVSNQIILRSEGNPLKSKYKEDIRLKKYYTGQDHEHNLGS